MILFFARNEPITTVYVFLKHFYLKLYFIRSFFFSKIQSTTVSYLHFSFYCILYYTFPPVFQSLIPLFVTLYFFTATNQPLRKTKTGSTSHLILCASYFYFKKNYLNISPYPMLKYCFFNIF